MNLVLTVGVLLKLHFRELVIDRTVWRRKRGIRSHRERREKLHIIPLFTRIHSQCRLLALTGPKT